MKLNQKGFTLVELMVVGLLLFVVPVLLAFWTDRNLDFWLTNFKGHEVNVPYWLSLIVTIAGNAVVIFANIIGEIARFAI